MSPGTRIGPYIVDALLGQGGMAQVYRARHSGLHRFEALKVLPVSSTFDRLFVERFLQEARTAAGLQHPNIIAIHSVSSLGDERPFFAMELIDGGDLADVLAARGSFSFLEALPILRQIALALDFAHSHGVIHRDIKPGNVMLSSEGRVKVVDFGIARAQEAGSGTRLTQAGAIVGTPEYLSPEQAGSGEVVNARTDQYSLAVVAYEMLCGRPPFGKQGDSALSVIMGHVRDEPPAPLTLVPSLPPQASAAIVRALSKNPAARFSSCVEFVSALEVIPTTSTKTIKAKSKRALLPAFGAAVLLGLVVLVTGFSAIRKHGEREVIEVAAPTSEGAGASNTSKLSLVAPGQDKTNSPTASSRPTSSAPDEASVRAFLTQWNETSKRTGTAAVAELFAPHVDRFFNHTNISRQWIADYRDRFAPSHIHQMTLSNVKVTFPSPQTAIADMDKTWDSTSGKTGLPFRGSELARLKLIWLDGRWQITWEEEVKVYWVDKGK